LKTDRNFTIERERPERDDEPGYSTFLSAAAEMPTFSDAELKGLDLGWRYRTAKLFSRAATSVPRAGSAPGDPDDRQ
jgi:hypothetical protein